MKVVRHHLPSGKCRVKQVGKQAYMGFCSLSTRMDEISKTDSTKCWEHVVHLEFTHIAGGSEMAQHWKPYGLTMLNKHLSVTQQFHSDGVPRRNRNTCPQKDRCMHVNYGFIHDSPQLEAAHQEENG